MALIKQSADGSFVFIRGKHEGQTLQEVAEADPSYLQWLQSDEKAGADLPKEAWEALETVMEENDIDPR